MPHPAGSIEVLLATWQGERFLRAQLDSLLEQDCGAFTIVVSDGGSTDATCAIVAEYAASADGRFRLLPPAAKQLGPLANFARLLDSAEADYVFFCDQDDVWLPDKMTATLAHMYQLEAVHGARTPLLVHTDLTVIDEVGRVLSGSFFRYAKIKPQRSDLSSLLTSNIATGCTMLINRALCELGRPVPLDAMMHDHWLAQVAAGAGVISCLNRPTILYRQHSHNAIGATGATVRSVGVRIRDTLFGWRGLTVLGRMTHAARALEARIGAILPPDERSQLLDFASLPRRGRLSRLMTLLRRRVHKHGLLQTIGLAILVLRLRRN